MEQFKQYGIISLLGIAFFTGIYSSIQLFDWFFFPWLQLGIISTLTVIIAAAQYTNGHRFDGRFLLVSWVFILLEWLICLILFNQPKLLTANVHLIFLPLLYFIYIALYQIILRRNARSQKLGRIIFYLLIVSTLTFFLAPTKWSAGGMELLFILFLAIVLLSKTTSVEQ